MLNICTLIFIRQWKVKYFFNSDGDYSKVDTAIEKVREMKTNLGYFILDTAKNEILDQP